MRLAVISDIHGNLPALEAVLADIAARDVDAVYHLGDLVGYGPWPNEVVERIRDEGIAGVAGNYDTTVAHGHTNCGCQYDDPRQRALSAESFGWTAARVTAANRRFLASLPFRLDVRPLGGHAAGPTLILVHGAATLNTVYWREDRSDRFRAKMVGLLCAREGGGGGDRGRVSARGLRYRAGGGRDRGLGSAGGAGPDSAKRGAVVNRRRYPHGLTPRNNPPPNRV